MSRSAEINRLTSKLYTVRDDIKRRMGEYFFTLPPADPKIRLAHAKKMFKPFIDVATDMLTSLEMTGGDSCDG